MTMKQTDQRQKTAPDAVAPSTRDMSTSPFQTLKPVTDSVSDNDTGEKPVREKLKKTSLASMSSHIVGREERPLKASEGIPTPGHALEESSPEQDLYKKDMQPRGRPLKKRSFDDLDTPEVENNEAGIEYVSKPSANGHLRKRSKDVRVGEMPTETRRPLLAGTPVREELEDPENGLDISKTRIDGPKGAVDSITPASETLSQAKTEKGRKYQAVNEPTQFVPGKVQGGHVTEMGKGSADQEMRDSASSPQKKRSRDQFDTEVDREQKIPATEEARAHRRSDELERGDVSAMRDRSSVLPKGLEAVGNEPVSAEGEKGLVPQPGGETQERPLKSAFGSASAFSPSITLARSDSSGEIATPATKTTDSASKKRDREYQTSADTFASSGFTALAGSSTSPFGTLGGSSTTASAGSFASIGVFNSGKSETDKDDVRKPKEATNGGFSTFVNSSSAGFGTTERSPFGTSGSSKTGVFGGSSFGRAFGGSLDGLLGAGSRLTSFAAPTGDARLGASNGAIKPIGSPNRDEDEDENSESEAEGTVENKKDEQTEEADGRFQHQDIETGEGGEDSIFSSRASLYSFRDNAWKESGKGIFKLNVASASPESICSDRKTGRFIMRAHQTYRVLLNVPVFKQMQIGDSRGNEPSGKSFLFAVIENAKPVAHMLKLGDVTDSKILYHKVRRLQDGLE